MFLVLGQDFRQLLIDMFLQSIELFLLQIRQPEHSLDRLRQDLSDRRGITHSWATWAAGTARKTGAAGSSDSSFTPSTTATTGETTTPTWARWATP